MVPFQAESQKLADENDITEDAPVMTLDAFVFPGTVWQFATWCLVLLCSGVLEIWTILDPSEIF